MTNNSTNATFVSITNRPKAVFEDIRNDCGEMFKCIRSSSEMPWHYHNYVEMVKSLSSDLTVTIGSNSYKLDKEDFIIILPGEHHEIIPASDDSEYILLDFDQNYIFSSALSSDDLKYILPGDKLRVFRMKNFYTHGGNTNSRHHSARDISLIFDSLVEECTEQVRFYKLAVRSHLAFLSLYILRQWKDANVLTRDKVADRAGISKIGAVLEIVNERYMDNLTAEEMAETAGMSYSYFSRFFKNTMNLTFSEYLNRKRIDESEVLLRNTDMPVADIAMAVGYSNTSYYIAQFRKRRMMTPKQYKLRYGSK